MQILAFPVSYFLGKTLSWINSNNPVAAARGVILPSSIERYIASKFFSQFLSLSICTTEIKTYLKVKSPFSESQILVSKVDLRGVGLFSKTLVDRQGYLECYEGNVLAPFSRIPGKRLPDGYCRALGIVAQKSNSYVELHQSIGIGGRVTLQN